MSDFEIVRAWLDYDENRHPVPWSKAHAALDRIEQDVAGLKVELADVSAELPHLRCIEEAAGDVDRAAGLQGSAKDLTAALRRLHAVLEGE